MPNASTNFDWAMDGAVSTRSETNRPEIRHKMARRAPTDGAVTRRGGIRTGMTVNRLAVSADGADQKRALGYWPLGGRAGITAPRKSGRAKQNNPKNQIKEERRREKKEQQSNIIPGGQETNEKTNGKEKRSTGKRFRSRRS